MNKTELLAPAGSREAAMAAIEHGADAVYFGLDTPTCFNARARASGIPPEELATFVGTIHRRGVRAYVTLNTLVFPDELAEVETLIRSIAGAGADAILVQDLGVARLVAAIAPELALHASTQMTLSSAEAIARAATLGIRRVVLPRELSLDDLRSIRATLSALNVTRPGGSPSMPELEVFVHGALCISFSGQCLASLAMGGRSGNRGRCAQSCRMPYHLLETESAETGGVRRRNVALDTLYPMSPLDLAALPLVPELIRAGVASFKIEGRLKPIEYVAEVTAAYRKAIDIATAQLGVELAAEANAAKPNAMGMNTAEVDTADTSATTADAPENDAAAQRAAMERLELTFTRGSGTGWLEGIDSRRLVPGNVSTSRGIVLGSLVAIRQNEVAVKLETVVRRGDGIVFGEPKKTGRMGPTRPRYGDNDQRNDSTGRTPQGGRVFEIFIRERASSGRGGYGRDGDRRGGGYGNGRIGGDRRGNSYRNDQGGAAEWTYRAVREGRAGDIVTLRFQGGAIDFGRLCPGMKVRKTDDPQIERETRRRLAGPPQRRVAVDLAVVAEVGCPLRVVATAENGAACSLESERPLELAEKHPLSEYFLQEQFGRLGGTIYELRNVAATIVGEPMLPLSAIGVLRRTMIEQLDAASQNVTAIENAADSANPEVISTVNRLAELRAVDTEYRQGRAALPISGPVVHLLSRSIRFFRNHDSLRRCVAAGCRSFYGEFADLGDYAVATRAVHELRAEFVAVTPRILKPGEDSFLTGILAAQPDAVLVRNLAALQFFRGNCTKYAGYNDGVTVSGTSHVKVIADFALNAANDLTATELLRWGVDRVTPAYDLNATGFGRLMRRFDPGRLEVVVLGRVPMFFAEHCLWMANVVPLGQSCSRICRSRPLSIQDRFGCNHPVTADPFCRNIISYSELQTAIEYVGEWIQRGLRHLRIELDDGDTCDGIGQSGAGGKTSGNGDDGRSGTGCPEASLIGVIRDLAEGGLWASRAMQRLENIVPLHPRSTWANGMPRPEHDRNRDF